jgi:hypothetical protein
MGYRGMTEPSPAPESTSRVVERALPWLLLAYCAASLLHFAHNAEYVADYPNLPSWLTSARIYLAWLAIFSLGLCGYLIFRRGHAMPGLLLLVVYTALGLDGLLHYGRAPMSAHTIGMNLTIWTEVVTAGVAPPRANVNRDSCLGQIKLQGSIAHEHTDELFHA